MKKYRNSGIIISFIMIIISSSFFFSFANVENSKIQTSKNDEKIEELKKQYLKATEEFKNGPIKFIEDRLCEHDKESHKKVAYEERFKELPDSQKWNIDTYNCYQYYLNDPQKEKYETETWFTFDNLRLQAVWLNKLNKLRATDDNFTDSENKCAVKLNPELMMESMMSAMIGFYQETSLKEYGHLFGSSNYDFPCIPALENLAWNYDDPFNGWYDDEKKLYDNGSRKNEDVGHYKTIMQKANNNTAVGFGMYGLSGVGTEKNGIIVWDGQKRGCDAMRIITYNAVGIENCSKYTADEWLKEVNAYEKELQDKVDKTKKAWEDAKYDPEVKVSTPENLVYNGEKQDLVAKGSVAGGKLLYSLDGEKWSQNIPTATDAGEYTVYYKVEGTDYYRNASVQKKAVTIKKADPVVTVKFADPDTLIMDPDNENKEFNFVDKSECKTTGGTLQFYDEDLKGWGAGYYPTAREAGKYTVRYRVKGNNNYNDVPEKSKEFEIKKLKSTANVEFYNDYTFDPSKTTQSLVKSETHPGQGIVQYQVEGQKNNEWSDRTPTVENAGTYTIRWRLEGNRFYEDIPASEPYTVTIKKCPQNPSIEFAEDFTCDGKNHYLVHYKGDSSSAPSLGKYKTGTIMYKLNDSDWTTDLPFTKEPGTYKVSYKIVPKDDNYEGVSEQTKTITIHKQKPSVTIKPASDSVYTGKYVRLFTASLGDVNPIIGSYELFYKVDDGDWTSYENISTYPKAKDAGVHHVKYKVESEGGYESIPEKEFTVTIAKKDASFASTPYEAKDWIYDPDYTNVPLCRAKAADSCTVLYSVNNGDWTTATPVATDAGTYNVRYKIQGNENVSDGEVKNFTVTVKPMSIGSNNSSVSANLNNDGFEYTQSYDGEEITPVKKDGVSVTYGSDTTFKEGKDYTLEGETSSATPGTHRIIVKGKGNLTGEREIQYKIVAPKKTDKPDSGNTDKPDSGNTGGNTGDSGSGETKPQKKDPKVTATLAKGLVFNYEQQKLCTEAKTTGGTLYLTIDGTTLEEPDKLMAKKPGTYTVQYQVYGNNEYNNASGTLGTVTIDKVDISKKDAVKVCYDEELKLYSKESTQKQNVKDVIDVQNDGIGMVKDVHYSLTGDLGDISKPGTYSFTIHGTGEYYKGEVTIPFKVSKMYSDTEEGGGNSGNSGNTEKPDPEEPDPKPEEPKTEINLFQVKASASSYIYDGKVHTPALKVYDEDGNLLSQDQYKVTYPSGRKNLGSYMIVITGKGDCKGTLRVAYTITPAKMKTPTVKAGKKKLTVKWKKLGGGSQTYQISVLKKGTKKAKYYTSTGSSKTISKLTKKKYYTVRMRSYKRINGKTYYGAWSGTKKVKVK